MNRNSVFVISEKSLAEFVKKYYEGHNTKDYEFVVALNILRNVQRANNTQYSAVFEFKDSNNDVATNLNPTPEDTHHIMRNLLMQDTPVDFAIVKGSPSSHDSEALAFQVKRFIGHSDETYTRDLLDYIDKTCKKYHSIDVSLIILADVTEALDGIKAMIDINFLRKNIDSNLNPFQDIYLITFDKESKLFKLT